ncbi:MAG: DUF11 domain-containing protein [Chloroflexi bacterium]|nr:DUF11 domain-containing protein [Chloroflexota bacterium]
MANMTRELNLRVVRYALIQAICLVALFVTLSRSAPPIETTRAAGVPDLNTSAKTVNLTTVIPFSSVVTYTIVLSNTGTDHARGASFTDTIPSGLFYIAGSATNSSGSLSWPDATTLRWTGTVTVGQPTTVTYRAFVLPPMPNGTIITNTAYITDGTGNPLTRLVTSTVSSAPNLSTSAKTSAPSRVAPGGMITYTIRITNTGSESGINQQITMTDQLPSNTSWDYTFNTGAVSYTVTSPASAGVGSYDHTSGQVGWAGDVAYDQSVTVTFRVTVGVLLTDGLVITNTAFIGNGRGTIVSKLVTNTVSSAPDFTTSTKSVSATTATPGDTITYTIRLTNTGNVDATAALVTDIVPGNLTYASNSLTATVGTPSYGVGSVLWTGPVTVGSSITITYRATLSSPLPNGTVITNTAQVDNGLGTITDTSVATTTVASAPRFSDSTKSVSPTSTYPGGVLTYTIVLLNDGTANGNVTLRDPLPANTSFAASSATSGYAPFDGIYLWYIDTVNVGSPVTITMRVTVSASAPVGSIISNTATLESGTGEPDRFSAAATVLPGAPVISSSSKTASDSSARPGDVLTYTIRVINSGTGNTTAWMTDTVPIELTYVDDSAISSSTPPPTWDSTSNQVRWSGPVSAGDTVTITFRAVVSSTASTTVVNTANIADSSGNQTSKSAMITIGSYKLFLPAIAYIYPSGW